MLAAVGKQLESLEAGEIAGPAWRAYGSITVAADPTTAVALMDDQLPNTLRSSPTTTTTTGSFGTTDRSLGPIEHGRVLRQAMAGTNHVLTAGGAKHSAGLSVSRFLKP